MLEVLAAGHLSAMAVLRALARPMLASIFIVQGYDTMRNPDRVVKAAEPVVRPIANRVSVVPDDTEQAVRLNGAVQFVAGTLLAAGWLPRLSALALAGTLVPTTAAGHRFWEAGGDEERMMQRIHFLKNVVMFGGLLIAAADTAGKPSLAWRGRHAVKEARREIARTAKTARTSAKAARAAAKAARASTSAKAARASAKAARASAAAKAARASAAAKAARTSGKARRTSGTAAKAARLKARMSG